MCQKWGEPQPITEGEVAPDFDFRFGGMKATDQRRIMENVKGVFLNTVLLYMYLS